MYKIYNSHTVLVPGNYLQKPNFISRKDHKHKIKRIFCKKDYSKFSFFPRTIVDWNQLDHEVFSSDHKGYLKKIKTLLVDPNCDTHC